MIGIITPGNKKYTPYIQNYLSVLDSLKTEYRVMSWDKRGLCEDGINMRFDYPINDSNRKKMFFGYIKFVRKCKQYIQKNNIDKLIILTAAPAFFMGKNYLKKFQKRMIIDIRDDSPFIRRFPNYFKKICSLAKTVVVSSNEFSPWTGRDTVLCHNADLKQLRLHKNDAPAETYNSPIRIVFAGVMIEEVCNIEMLKEFEGDSRFAHVFIGRDCAGKQMLQDFVNARVMDNVSFEGAYNKDEIIDIYRRKADLINIFRAKTTVNRNALPNKLYEAVLSGRPIVVFEHNIAIAHYACEYNLGIIVPDRINHVNEFVYDELMHFDYIKYSYGRNRFLNAVDNDMKLFSESIQLFAEDAR